LISVSIYVKDFCFSSAITLGITAPPKTKNFYLYPSSKRHFRGLYVQGYFFAQKRLLNVKNCPWYSESLLWKTQKYFLRSSKNLATLIVLIRRNKNKDIYLRTIFILLRALEVSPCDFLTIRCSIAQN